MTVAVAQPGQKRDTASEIANAVNIATTLFGVASQIKGEKRAERELAQERELFKIAQAEKDREKQAAFASTHVPATKAKVEEARKLGVPVLGKEMAPPGFSAPEEAVGFIPAAALAEERELNRKLASAAKAEKKAASKEQFSRTQSLADDYRSLSKDTMKAVDGYKRLEAAATNPNPSGATDLALIFGFMKTIDPGSTVREGEFANAENSQGIGEQTRNMYNKVLKGERLTPEGRQKFLTEARRAMAAQLKTQEVIDNRFVESSRNFGVDPKFVVSPVFEQVRQELQQNQGAPVNIAGQQAPQPQQQQAQAPSFETSVPGISLTPQQAAEILRQRKQQNTAGQ